MAIVTAKRIHLSLTERDRKLLDELEQKLNESRSGVIRRSVEHYHRAICSNQYYTTNNKDETK